MLITLACIVVLYILVVVTMRVMGKRQIGELEPYELAITIMIAELARRTDAGPPDSTCKWVYFNYNTFVHSSLPVNSPLKFHWARHILDGSQHRGAPGPDYGRRMRRARYNLNELLEQLRIKGLSFSDVKSLF